MRCRTAARTIRLAFSIRTGTVTRTFIRTLRWHALSCGERRPASASRTCAPDHTKHRYSSATVGRESVKSICARTSCGTRAPDAVLTVHAFKACRRGGPSQTSTNPLRCPPGAPSRATIGGLVWRTPASATRRSSRMVIRARSRRGREHDTQPGRLVLLEGDPPIDIANTHRVPAVILENDSFRGRACSDSVELRNRAVPRCERTCLCLSAVDKGRTPTLVRSPALDATTTRICFTRSRS